MTNPVPDPWAFREPALLGIPEERHIAATEALPPHSFPRFEVTERGTASEDALRLKLLASEVFYVRDYADVLVNGDRSLAYAGQDLIRESRYLNKVRERWDDDLARPLPLATPRAMMAFNRPWRNYYHWVLQCLFSIYVAERFDPDPDRTYLLPAGSQARMPMLSLLGVDEKRLAFFPDRGIFTLPQVSYCNAVRASVNPMMRQFREFLVGKVPQGAGPRRALYISRRDTPKRKLAIETALEAEMESRGVEIVVASQLSFAEQIATFRDCRLLIAPHGAGLTNMLFCEPGTTVVEIRPSYLQNQAFTALARVCGHDYTLIKVEAADSESRAWSANTSAVLDILDDVIARTPAG